LIVATRVGAQLQQ